MNELNLINLFTLIARFGVFSELQLIKFYGYDNRFELKALLKNASFKSEWISVPVSSEKKITKNSESGRVKIWYLGTEAKDFARRNPDIVPAKFACDKPEGVRFLRIFHELLVVEVFLWCIEQFGNFEYFTENELKSKDENPADLRIIRSENNEEIILDCEVVVKNWREQIAAKDGSMLYFTPSIRQKEIIEAEHKTEAIFIKLDSVVNKELNRKRELNMIQQSIYDELFKLNFGLTAAALAILVERDRAYVAGELAKLVEIGVVKSAAIQPQIGKSTGCPYKLFAIKDEYLSSTESKTFGFLYSKSIIKLDDTAYKIVHIDRDNRFFVIDFAFGSRRVCYVDDCRNAIKTEADRFALIKKEALRKGMEYLFIANEYKRFLKMRKDYREYFCYAFSTQN